MTKNKHGGKRSNAGRTKEYTTRFDVSIKTEIVDIIGRIKLRDIFKKAAKEEFDKLK